MDNKLQPDTALTAIFKANPGKLVPKCLHSGFYSKPRMIEVVVATGALRRQIVTTNKQTPSFFLQAGCPSCHPTNSVKALTDKSITFHRLAHSKLTWGPRTLS